MSNADQSSSRTDAAQTAGVADVAVIGGGLAGLTLALHLRQRNPDLAVHVIERREHPVREGAFKVGESTVEIGAHYLAEVLGLREHLDDCHLRKFGFRFFFSDGRVDIDQCTELGVSRILATPSWQIDRGRFENFLAERVRAAGARLDGGAVVRGIELSAHDGQPHRIDFDRAGRRHRLTARWVIDASGRAGLLKRKLGLARANAHDCNAVWWRVSGRIDPQDWSDDLEWLQRCSPPDRWRSTNHLCGPGYWVWLIPLSSGAHSIGIVCDARLHPLQQMNTLEKAMQWLHRHQPHLAAVLSAGPHVVQDFAFLRDYSYDCEQSFSRQRWAITGEAGCFLDPFYSPGTDFIAIANTYICDLVERDRAGRGIDVHARHYQILFESFYRSMLTIYQDQYPLFGDPRIMPVKVIWDYAYYWALLAPIFFAGRITDVAMFSRLRAAFARAGALNLRVQRMFQELQRRNAEPAASKRKLLDQYRIDWFREMNRALGDARDEAALQQFLEKNVDCLEALAADIEAALARDRPVASTAGALGADHAGARKLEPAWYDGTG